MLPVRPFSKDSARLKAVFCFFSLATLLSSADLPEESERKETRPPVFLDLGEDVVVAPAAEPGSLAARKAPFVSVLKPEEAPADRELGEALGSALGVHVESLGGLGKLATMSIRGSSGNQVAVLIDGIRLSGGTGAVDLSNLPLSHFERIEVLRGSASARFGDAAMGGVVNLVTRRAREGAWGAATVTTGLFTGVDNGDPLDVFRVTSSVGYGTEKWNSMVNVEGLWTNGQFLYEPDPSAGLGTRDAVRENNSVQSMGALLKGSWYLNDDWEFYGLMDLFGAHKEIPGLITFPTPEATQDDRRLLVAAGSRIAVSEVEGLTIDGRLTFLGEWITYQDQGGGTGGFAFRSENEDSTAGAESTVRYRAGEHHTFSFTPLVRYETYGDGEGKRRRRTTGFFSLADEMTLLDESFSLVPQVGFEAASEGEELTGVSVGAAYDVLPWLSVRANGGTGFRRPTFTELYYNKGYYVGNPDLKAERSMSVDVGPHFDFGFAKGEAAYFLTSYDDLIVYILQSGFRYRPFNVGKARAQGVEVGGSLEAEDRARLEANWTYAEVLDRTDDPLARDRQVPGKPRNQVMVRGELTLGSVKPFAEYHFVGKNPVTRSNTKMLPARHLVHLGVSWRLGEGVAFEVLCKNLTDERAVDVRGFPLPSRTVYFSVRFNW